MDTLFAPTPNHPLHAGHAWVAFLNWLKADLSGGKFIVLWDDVNARIHCAHLAGFPLQGSIDQAREDLKWLGFAPDAEFLSSDNAPAQRAACEALGYAYPHCRGHIAAAARHPVMGGQWGHVAERNSFHAAAHYDPSLTTCYVADDRACGVAGYFTGRMFLPECLLYEDIWARLGYGPSPWREFVPEVARGVNNPKESKSDGACSLAELRAAGYKPWQIISTLRECDRRSVAAGLASLVIPYGYLTPDKVRWLEYRGDVQDARNAWEGAVKDNAPQAEDLRQCYEEAKRTNRRRQETLLDAP